MSLNHYAINQVVKGTMVSGKRPRFGRFGLLGATSELLKYRPRPKAKVVFDIDSDRKVFDAFVKVADGASAESVVLDKSFAAKFHSAARKAGFHASDADLNRRLINIRKNPARYKKSGLILPPVAPDKVVPRPSIVPRYAHVIEFSLARLHSRYGVTIDDILIDPDLAEEYEQMALSAAPGLSSLELRLAALYIRKTRYIADRNEKLIDSLNSEKIESKFVPLGTMLDVLPNDVQDTEGLIEILENGRHLYISRNQNLRSAVGQIASNETLKFMANDFWTPKPDRIQLRAYYGQRFLQVPVSQWQLKLISVKRPVFNWPIAA